MRVLLSGVVGAAASASAWLAAEHFQQTSFGWMVCLIGLVTGVVMHKASNAGTGAGFARGGLAVVLTLAAIVGGRQAYAMIMQASSPTVTAVALESLQGREDESETESVKTDGEIAAEFDMSTLEGEVAGLGSSNYSKSSMKKSMSDWDMIWMGIAALAAYVTGKGGETAAAVVATEEPQEEATDEAQETPEKDEE